MLKQGLESLVDARVLFPAVNVDSSGSESIARGTMRVVEALTSLSGLRCEKQKVVEQDQVGC